MENKSYEQFIIMQASIEPNKQYTREEIRANKQDYGEKMTEFKKMLAVLTNNINTLVYSPTQTNLKKTTDTKTVVPYNRRDPQLDSGHYTKCLACGLSSTI